MATTTTYEAIRDNYILRIEALTPRSVSEYKFRRSPRDQTLKSFATSTGSAAFRAFEFMRGSVTEPDVMDPSAYECSEECMLTIAYPTATAIYGRADLDEVEWAMRNDAQQVRDLLFSSPSFIAGQSAGFPDIEPPDRSDPLVWFNIIRIGLVYTVAQQLT